VLRDKSYFDNSGGGITLTGGDPLYQPEFATEILRLSKKSGLHTCLETSGAYEQVKVAMVSEFTDLFLYDFKHYKNSEHLKYTNVSNRQVLDNLDYLCRKGKEVVLRCPVIPGVNNTIDHFRAITAISNRYDSITAVEIMPFHNWGFHKYEQIGMKRPEIYSGGISDKTIRTWIAMIKEAGCKKILNR
jgi:pyruvate formate lyase activating enzyme